MLVENGLREYMPSKNNPQTWDFKQKLFMRFLFCTKMTNNHVFLPKNPKTWDFYLQKWPIKNGIFFSKMIRKKEGIQKKSYYHGLFFLKIDLQTGFISKNDQHTGHFYNIDQDLQTWQK